MIDVIMKKRLRLVLDMLDQPEVDKFADRLKEANLIKYSWPGIPSMEILKLVNEDKKLVEDYEEVLDRLIKRYEK